MFSICLYCFSGYSTSNIQPEQNVFIVKSFPISKEDPTILPIFTLVMSSCETVTTICCYADTQRFCNLPGATFSCYFGGSFECSPDIGDCMDNPSNCSACCITC